MEILHHRNSSVINNCVCLLNCYKNNSSVLNNIAMVTTDIHRYSPQYCEIVFILLYTSPTCSLVCWSDEELSMTKSAHLHFSLNGIYAFILCLASPAV